MRVAVRRVLPDPGTPARAVAYILFLHVLAGTVLGAAPLQGPSQLAGPPWARLGLLGGPARGDGEAGGRGAGGPRGRAGPHWARLGLLVALAGVNVEAGRRAEGGRIDRDRPHKALSAWAFAAALVLPVSLAMLVVVPTYWHARLRGIRMPLWKWIGSAE